MGAARNRREFLAVLSAASLAVGCSRAGSGGSLAPNSAVTIRHVFGETTIPSAPTRVVSAGFTEADDLLAVGVVPIAVTNWFGDEPFGVWSWAQPKLGGAKPALLNLDNGIQVDKIAALKPDLIVAVNAGLDSGTYQKLAAIAPTIAQSDGDAFFEPWKTQADTIGKALFKADEMATIIDGVEEKFRAAGQSNSQFKDRTAALLAGRFFGDTITATAAGWRTDFLTEMGFQIPQSLKAMAGNDGYADVPRTELAATLDAVDVVIWTTESDAEQAALEADKAIAELRTTRGNRDVFTTKDLAAAIAYASPLSYPVVAEQLPPLLARALG